METFLSIELPSDFSDECQRPILKYLVEERWTLSYTEWQVVLHSFDLLHRAKVVVEGKVFTFRQVYADHVEHPFANLYITALLKLVDVSQGYAALRARLARSIVKRLQRSGFRRYDVPESNLVLAYCLYFWESFASGYAFEVEDTVQIHLQTIETARRFAKKYL